MVEPTPTDTDRTGYPLSRLADVYRAAGPWTSVYLDVRRDTEDAFRTIELRWQALRTELAGLGAPDADLAAIDAVVAEPTGRPGPACRYLLVGRSGVAVDETLPGPPVHPERVDHGPVASTLPLVLHHVHDLTYLLVEAGRDGGRISAYQASRRRRVWADELHGATRHLTKVRGGGWAHGHYLKNTEEVWRRNAAQLAGEVERARQRTGAGLVVLSGDVRAREKVAGQVPTETGRLLVQLDTHTRTGGADQHALDDAVTDQLDDLAEQHERTALDLLAQRLGTGRGVTGLAETVAALRQAQVDVLLLDPAELAGCRLLALHSEPWVATDAELGSGAERGIGTALLAEIPAVDALLRAGALIDASVLPVTSDRLPQHGAHGAVAALLRWP